MTTDDTPAAGLLALADRCEAATGPDSGLDVEICIAVGWVVFGIEGATNIRPDPDDVGWMLYEVDAEECTDRAPVFTAILDAAMSLVPNGWRILGLHETEVEYVAPFEVRLGERNAIFGRGRVAMGNAATLEHAVCAAALRARANPSTTRSHK